MGSFTDLGILSPFTIPSGVVTTVPSAIARIARDVPEVGFLTTKTLSIAPREGYREPVIHEYYPGCFVNAVGLANPGAEGFRDAMRPLLPLHGGKPLVVSIMGADANEFLACALILDPIADAFELNLSCPHVKGAGQCVGSDPASVQSIIKLLKGRLRQPIILKLSPNLGDVAGMALLCEQAGADGLCLINTVGPGVATDAGGNPVLSNVIGGLSGSGIFPVGLKAVREAAAVVRIPIIASGGISEPCHVRSYRKAGASFFAVGSALAGMTTPRVGELFSHLAAGLEETDRESVHVPCPATRARTAYVRTTVVGNEVLGPGFFALRLADGPACRPGQFFFLRLPEVGEKPFSPASDRPPVYLVRAVGPFTRALEVLKSGDEIYLRGPYGKGFPEISEGSPVVLVGGGTGAAPLMMAAAAGPGSISDAFFGFSAGVGELPGRFVRAVVPDAHIVVDPPDRVGEVVRAVARHTTDNLDRYTRAFVFLCGPKPMMEATVAALSEVVAAERILMAREDVMRCGIGLCGSCGTQGGLRSCVDGPVMPPDPVSVLPDRLSDQEG